MLDYPALAALSQIIRRGSFEAAASALGVTPSAISQRIKSLEERMGQVLIHRGPPASGTETGLRLMQHFDQVQLLERSLTPSLQSDAATATLRLAVNADSLATWFMPALSSLSVRYDLVIDDQDHARDWLRQGQVSAAITSEPLPVTGCDARPLGAMRYLALASPAYIARHFPDGPNAKTLTQAPAVIFNAKDGLQARWAEALTGRRIQPDGHRIPSSEAFAEAVSMGLGWGMIPEIMAKPALDRGDLRPIAPDRPLDVRLYWHIQRAMAAAMAPLTHAVEKRAAETLRP